MLAGLKKLLSSPRSPWIAAALAVLLFLPVLGAGLMMDDYVQRVSFETALQPRPRPAWDLFDFQGPDRAELAENIRTGIFPWWTPPTFRMAFFRPLSGLSHWLDYHFIPDHPAVMHAENLALFAGMALVAALLYRRLVAPLWAAGLAGLLFAIDDAHSLVVGWIANRNALLAGVLGLGALWLHDRARRDGARWAAYLAPLALALALAGGEAALAVFGYLAAYALFLDDAPPRARLLSLAPYLAVLVGWIVIYKAGGYGSSGSGFYIDPGADPAAFVIAVAGRLPILLLAQLGLPPSELWPLSTTTPIRALLVAAAVVCALGVAFARVLRGDRRSRFFAAGMLGSLLPVCSVWPNDRVLLFSGFGAFGLIATFLARVGEVPAKRERLALKAVAGLLVVIHLVLAPLLLPIRTLAVAHMFHDYILRGEGSLPDDLGKTLLVVNAPDPLVSSYSLAVRHYTKNPYHSLLRLLSVTIEGSLTVERIDDHTLSLSPSEGFVHDPFSRVFRSGALPFKAGEVIAMEGMRAEVVELDATGLPRRVHFHFDDALDDPSMRWVIWRGTRFVPFQPPPAGAKVTLPAIDYFAAMLDKEP